ncbi:MAG: enoyl-CoA hydratase/isomerase family protein [Acidimicrobiales bacterium]
MDVDGLLALAPTEIERLSVLASPEPLVVRGASEAVDVDELRAVVGRIPTVTILVAPAGPDVATCFDICVSEEPDPDPPWVHGDIAEIAAAVHAHPLAAVSLVALLRTSADGDVWAGLAQESAVYAALMGGADFRAWLATQDRAIDASPAVLVERDDDRLTVTLNRPTVHNAFNRAMRDGLVEALQLAAVDATITEVQLQGAGASFCSGGDLGEFGTVEDPPTAHAVRLTRHPGWWTHVCADRVVARLHGACIGAGIELPAFGARVEATPDAFFALPEVGMGLVPGAGGTVSVPRRIGRQRTAWWALTGARIDAATALRWGLVDRVSPDGLSPNRASGR